MIYTIANHPTMYKNTLFRSRLEARWAAFFDSVGWRWEYEAVDLQGWTPDFLVTVPGLDFASMADYSEFLAEVKPYRENAEWKGHPVTLLNPTDGCSRDGIKIYDPLVTPGWGCMALGSNPDVSRVSLHYHKWNSYVGPLAGLDSCLDDWSSDGSASNCYAADVLEWAWAEAGNVTRWRP